MNKRLLIIGAGSFSPEVEAIARMNGYNDIAFLDDHPEKAECRPVIGKMDDIPRFATQYENAIVALGNNETRIKFHRRLVEAGYQIPVLIHPTAFISPDAILAPGCIIRTNAVVSRFVSLGEAVIVNVGALIDHHCVLDHGCHILMGAVVRNKKHLPPLTWLSANQVAE